MLIVIAPLHFKQILFVYKMANLLQVSQSIIVYNTMEYFPFLYEKKKKKEIEQIPLYIDVPDYAPPPKEKEADPSVIIIELF